MIPAEDIDRALCEGDPANTGGRGEIIAAGREGYVLHLGDVEFEWLPCGCVLVCVPAAFMPFGVAIRANVLYRDLRAFLAAMRRMRP